MILRDEKLAKHYWFLKRSKLTPRGQRPSQHKHIPMLALGLDSNKNNGALNEKKRMRPPREGHHLKQGKGPNVKRLIGPVCATNVPLETPPNY